SPASSPWSTRSNSTSSSNCRWRVPWAERIPDPSSRTEPPGDRTHMTQTLDKPAGLPILLNGRQDRPRSFDLADFPSVTGREEEWRFTPVKRLADLLSEEPASASLTVDAQLPDGV